MSNHPPTSTQQEEPHRLCDCLYNSIGRYRRFLSPDRIHSQAQLDELRGHALLNNQRISQLKSETHNKDEKAVMVRALHLLSQAIDLFTDPKLELQYRTTGALPDNIAKEHNCKQFEEAIKFIREVIIGLPSSSASPSSSQIQSEREIATAVVQTASNPGQVLDIAPTTTIKELINKEAPQSKDTGQPEDDVSPTSAAAAASSSSSSQTSSSRVILKDTPEVDEQALAAVLAGKRNANSREIIREGNIIKHPIAERRQEKSGKGQDKEQIISGKSQGKEQTSSGKGQSGSGRNKETSGKRQGESNKGTAIMQAASQQSSSQSETRSSSRASSRSRIDYNKFSSSGTRAKKNSPPPATKKTAAATTNKKITAKRSSSAAAANILNEETTAADKTPERRPSTTTATDKRKKRSPLESQANDSISPKVTKKSVKQIEIKLGMSKSKAGSSKGQPKDGVNTIKDTLTTKNTLNVNQPQSSDTQTKSVKEHPKTGKEQAKSSKTKSKSSKGQDKVRVTSGTGQEKSRENTDNATSDTAPTVNPTAAVAATIAPATATTRNAEIESGQPIPSTSRELMIPEIQINDDDDDVGGNNDGLFNNELMDNNYDDDNRGGLTLEEQRKVKDKERTALKRKLKKEALENVGKCLDWGLTIRKNPLAIVEEHYMADKDCYFVGKLSNDERYKLRASVATRSNVDAVQEYLEPIMKKKKSSQWTWAKNNFPATQWIMEFDAQNSSEDEKKALIEKLIEQEATEAKYRSDKARKKNEKKKLSLSAKELSSSKELSRKQ